jgi:ParB/RepB/Spo0J family partition protein
MADMVKYINLSELIPGEIHPHLETNNDNLDNLTNSIKNYGILEPLIVRPKDNKYEIILGNRRYKAAKILNLEQIPVIILNIDNSKALEIIISDNIHRKELSSKEEALLYSQALSINNNTKEKLSNDLGIPLDRITSKLNLLNKKNYTTINNNNNNKVNSQQTNTSINSDIINLSELNKEEFERDEQDMNNNQFINNNNQLNEIPQPEEKTTPNNQEPTFGGRFFPSLEDEPTNMNLNNSFNNQSTMNISAQQPSQLIDLTDLSTPNQANQPQPESISQTVVPNLEQISQPSLEPTSDVTNTQEQILQNVPNLTDNMPINQATNQINDISSPTKENQPNIQNDVISNLINNNQPTENSNELPGVQIPNMSTPINDSVNIPQMDISEPTLNLQPNQELENPLSQQLNIPTNPSIDLPNLSQDIPQVSQQTISIPDINLQQPSSELPSLEPNNTISPEINLDNLNINVDNNQIPQSVDLNSSENKSQKDIVPIVNMIKNLVISIEGLGYNLKINETDLENSYKIEIEVEK